METFNHRPDVRHDLTGDESQVIVGVERGRIYKALAKAYRKKLTRCQTQDERLRSELRFHERETHARGQKIQKLEEEIQELQEKSQEKEKALSKEVSRLKSFKSAKYDWFMFSFGMATGILLLHVHHLYK